MNRPKIDEWDVKIFADGLIASLKRICQNSQPEESLLGTGMEKVVYAYFPEEGYPTEDGNPIDTLCQSCALNIMFNGDENLLHRMLIDEDISFIDANGFSYDIEHEGSIDFDSFPMERYEQAIICDACGMTCVEANEDYF